MELRVVAHAENGFTSKFGIPRQSGLSSAETKIVFEPEFRSPEAVRGIEQFSHLWLIWGFSEGFANGSREFSPTVRPPRLGGNKRVGVFATRSPNRPNPLGLTVVKLCRVEHTERGEVLVVRGADMMNGTPIYDIKPYIAYADSVPDAVSGFADETAGYALTAELPKDLTKNYSEDFLAQLREILENDPRPSYRQDGEREYSFEFSGCAVSFKVEDGRAVLTRLEKSERK